MSKMNDFGLEQQELRHKELLERPFRINTPRIKFDVKAERERLGTSIRQYQVEDFRLSKNPLE